MKAARRVILHGREAAIRPRSIIWFDRLFLGALALTIAFLLRSYAPLMNELGSEVVFIGGIALASIAINLLLWFFISRRASTAAKWFLVVYFALGLVSSAMSFSAALRVGSLSFAGLASGMLPTFLKVAALIMLFRTDARAWFASNGKMHQHEAGVFE